MIQSSIKFENLVIFCGIIQCVIIIFALITKYEILLQLVMFFQLLIYLNIIRRFLRIFNKMQSDKKENIKSTHNLYVIKFS
jgi:hypothetical protein